MKVILVRDATWGGVQGRKEGEKPIEESVAGREGCQARTRRDTREERKEDKQYVVQRMAPKTRGGGIKIVRMTTAEEEK